MLRNCTLGEFFWMHTTVCSRQKKELWILDFQVLYISCLFVFGATAPIGSGPPHSRRFCITHNDAPQSVGLLWTSDQLVAETSTGTTHNIHNRQTSMTTVGFKPTISAGERPQTYAVERAATGYLFLARQPPRAFSLSRFLDHTQRLTTVGRTPLDEWSTRRRDLYLTTHNRQTSMPPVGFELTIAAGERP